MSTRRVRRILMAGILCGLLSPAAASAQIGKGWLERLSGPGPFKGWTVDLRLFCMAMVREGQQEIATTLDENESLKSLTPEVGSRAWATPVGCHFLSDRDRPRMELGFSYSPLSSRANTLDYSHLSTPPADTGINLRMFLLTADLRVNRVLDVGAGFGWARFSPQGGLFPGFTSAVGQPLRLTTRPLTVMFGQRRHSDWLLIQFDGLRFKRRFTAEDFGARPGSFDEPGEMIWSWQFKVDGTAWLWK